MALSLEDPVTILFLLAFAPALLYLAGLAWTHRGPSIRYALTGFAYGATMSLVVLALLYVGVASVFGDPEPLFRALFAERAVAGAQAEDFVLIVIMAPLLEEAAKGLGVGLLGWRLGSARDGAFLGAAVGLGFAAIETFTYLLGALGAEGGRLAGATFVTVVIVAFVRSVSAGLLHPAATGLTGYGIGRAKARGRPVLLGALPYYIVAVVLHGTYNYFAAFLPPQDVGGFSLEVNLLAAMLLAGLAYGVLKRSVASRT